MNHPELVLITLLRAMTEVALLTLFGQGVLALLAGSRRDSNPVYRIFRIVTDPVVKLVRWLTPKLVIDRHIPYVSFFLLFWLWILLAYLRQAYCTAWQLQC